MEFSMLINKNNLTVSMDGLLEVKNPLKLQGTPTKFQVISRYHSVGNETKGINFD